MSFALNTHSDLIRDAIDKISINNYLPPLDTPIAVGMSGGVDSSATAALLKVMGYNVVGITGWLTDNTNKSCDGARFDAERAAEQIGIEHHIVDLREIFDPIIVNPFLNAYSEGRTPVPCMTCNTEIKWGSLLHYSKSLGATHFASGHYVRLIHHTESQNFQGGFSIGRPTDLSKDQSYMLWTLNQEQMNRAFFPLANFTKEETRAIAIELNLFNAEKPESQDICFVPNKTSDYLKDKLGERPGEVRHIQTSKVMGEHLGAHLYTVGQRKGLGIAHPTPLYVVKLDPIQNIVYVGDKEHLFAKGLIANNVNWQIHPNQPEFKAQTKIRYATPPCYTDVKLLTDASMELTFQEAQSSITPGQAAVLYDESNQFILGGGWISREIL